MTNSYEDLDSGRKGKNSNIAAKSFKPRKITIENF